MQDFSELRRVAVSVATCPSRKAHIGVERGRQIDSRLLLYNDDFRMCSRREAETSKCTVIW